MTKLNVLVTFPTIADAAKQILRDAGAEVTYINDTVITEDILIAQLAKGINAVFLRGSPPLTRRVIESARELRIIAKHGAGIDSVDLETATARGIVVVNAGGANADSVAEQSVAMMLSLARDLPQMTASLKAGRWDKPKYLGRDFRGRLVGIVGYGEIGQRTAKLAALMGARIAVYTRSRVPADKLVEGAEVETDLERLIGRVDILSLHLPLTEKTRNLINARTLGLMKPTALLINTARGGVVDEAALYDALKNGKIAGAGLDVFAKEPTDPKNPLFTLENVIVAPHVAAITEDTLTRLGVVTANNIIGWLQRHECDTDSVANPQVLEKQT
jgi:D-3-phosphoglycerate dehydrogenase